jgi:hypothetical protein
MDPDPDPGGPKTCGSGGSATLVHVDMVGPLTASSKGHVYLLTAIDRSTGWVEAVPLRNWVARFVVPATFVATPLLGMNFLTMIGLSIIPAKQQVLHAHARDTL